MVSVAIFSSALFVSRSETVCLAHRKCWWGPGPSSAMQAYVDSILPFDRCFACIFSVPGPGNTVLSKRTSLCPHKACRSGGETCSKQPLTQSGSNWMTTTLKGKAQRSRNRVGGGPDLVCREVREGWMMSAFELRSENLIVTAQTAMPQSQIFLTPAGVRVQVPTDAWLFCSAPFSCSWSPGKDGSGRAGQTAEEGEVSWDISCLS